MINVQCPRCKEVQPYRKGIGYQMRCHINGCYRSLTLRHEVKQ